MKWPRRRPLEARVRDKLLRAIDRDLGQAGLWQRSPRDQDLLVRSVHIEGSRVEVVLDTHAEVAARYGVHR